MTAPPYRIPLRGNAVVVLSRAKIRSGYTYCMITHNPIRNHRPRPPHLDSGILLAHGQHKLSFFPEEQPDRVYVAFVAHGGAGCGTPAEADYATVELLDDGFVVNAVVG